MPTGLTLQAVDSWGALKRAVEASEGLFAVAGEVSGTGTADVASLKTAINQMSGGLAQLMANVKTLGCDERFRSAPLPEVSKQLRDLQSAITVCHMPLLNASRLYQGEPPDAERIFADIKRAADRQKLLERVHELSATNSDWMPVGSMPGEMETWSQITAGVNVAQRLSGMIKVTVPLTEALCHQGRIDSLSLKTAADAVDATRHNVKKGIESCEERMRLPYGERDSTDVNRRPLSALKELVNVAATELTTHASSLEEVCQILRNGHDLPVTELPGKIQTIRKLRSILPELSQNTQRLEALGVREVKAADKPRAEWLRDFAVNDRITPLIKMVATDSDIRSTVMKADAGIKSAMALGLKESWTFLRTLFDIQADISTGLILISSPVGEIANHFTMLKEKSALLEEWIRFSRWNRDMDNAGFDGVVSELIEGKIAPDETTDVVSLRFHRVLFDRLAESEKTLGEFSIEEHERIQERFRQLDQWEIRAAAKRIREYQLGREDRPNKGFSAAVSSELGVLQREISKKRKHLPLRRLFAEIAGVMQRLKPCIMMSPLSVSTFLDTADIRFDLIIFDEASQVFPWDAIGAIYRGRQLIVAGDEKQLPPTNFFSRADNESEEEDDIADFESILTLCKAVNMPTKRLRWHYRSRREPLIAFSNRHFYDGDLVTFPSTMDASGDSVRLELVPDGRWVERKNVLEAERITDLVIEHLKKRPNTSIGVIAFNQSQQRCIEDTIYDRRRKDRIVDALFSIELPEPLFVKNLENVQGDERDVILLSMGYAPNDAGRFLKNFGPLSKSGGERRLNVAVTRAREQVVLVASVRAADMDLSGSKTEGAHLLKAYLEYAEKGVDTLGLVRQEIAGDVESPFEEDVANALIRRGLEPVAQVGCSGFRIDLALKHPERPGEFCLGIECDGATYHSSKTARDRDRIRQSVLEALGWKIIRVWSTDWIRNPDYQNQRILDAYESSVVNELAVEITDTETTDDDLEPEFVDLPTASSVRVKYASIDDVQDGVILDCAQTILMQAGATGTEDLMRMISRELGFMRMGARIRTRLDSNIAEGINQGKLRQVDDRIWLARSDTGGEPLWKLCE
jgi:very-short-patch-repair endonuclease